MATGFLWDERFAWFDAGNVQRGPFVSPLGAFNTRESKERIRELLVTTGTVDRLTPIAPRLMSEEELARLKARVLSGLVMQQESSRSRTSNIVLDWYYLGRARTLEEVEQIVNDLTCDKINDYLRRHPPAEYTVATIGPEPLEVPIAVS